LIGSFAIRRLGISVAVTVVICSVGASSAVASSEPQGIGPAGHARAVVALTQKPGTTPKAPTPLPVDFSDGGLDEQTSDPDVSAAVGRLDPYVVPRNGGLTLDAPDKILAGVAPDVLDKLEQALAIANQQISDGGLAVNSAGELAPRGSGDQPTNASASKRGGHSKCKWYWIPTCHYYMTKTQTDVALNGSTATATVIGSILGGPIGGALAGFLYNSLKSKITNNNWCGVLGYPVPLKILGHYVCGT
jgi:hypothetical protein